MLITGQQSKEVRESLNISQNKTAQGADVNRGYLSLFEAGKFDMPEHYLKKLIAFYESKGAVFDDKEITQIESVAIDEQPVKDIAKEQFIDDETLI